MYDHDDEDLEVLGWEEFVLRQWESVFIGYRSNAGLRTICRRWSDLFEAGLRCSQDFADELVRAEILESADHDLVGTAKPAELLTGMAGVLVAVRRELEEAAHMAPERRSRMLGQHKLLCAVVLDDVDPDEAPGATP